MKTKMTHLLLLLLLLFITVESCHTDEKQPEQRQHTLDANLYILSINAATFNKLPDTADIVFSFKLGLKQALTLGGWTKPKKNSDSFNNKPNLELEVTKSITGTIKSGTYFNNLILDTAAIKAIKAELASTNNRIVFFTPKYLPGLTNIAYDISTAANKDDQPGVVTVMMNPSPPKQYN